jgi:hypothetical protein
MLSAIVGPELKILPFPVIQSSEPLSDGGTNMWR